MSISQPMRRIETAWIVSPSRSIRCQWERGCSEQDARARIPHLKQARARSGRLLALTRIHIAKQQEKNRLQSLDSAHHRRKSRPEISAAGSASMRSRMIQLANWEVSIAAISLSGAACVDHGWPRVCRSCNQSPQTAARARHRVRWHWHAPAIAILLVLVMLDIWWGVRQGEEVRVNWTIGLFLPMLVGLLGFFCWRPPPCLTKCLLMGSN